MSVDRTSESPIPGVDDADPFAELLRRTHLSSPSEVGRVIVEEAARLGALSARLHVADYEQRSLVALDDPDGPPTSIAGTLAGRAFASTSILTAEVEDAARTRAWIPLLDGTERIGLMELVVATGAVDEPLLARAERYAHLAAILLVAKSAYGDALARARRRRPMTIASELAWSLAPPQVFATDDLVLSGMLEPCYDNGGDALDYALDGRTLHVAVFDAMGHGLAAAGAAAFAISAYRHSRRAGADLAQTYRSMDRAVGEQFPGEHFVTALIAELDLDDGTLTWISAGHPQPLVVRDGRGLQLAGTPTTPLGVPAAGPAAAVSQQLEPGDLLLLYTDGLSEASDQNGKRFGIDGLSAFIEREAAAGLSVPETLRRLRHSFVDAAGEDLADDATAILIAWRRGQEVDLLP